MFQCVGNQSGEFLSEVNNGGFEGVPEFFHQQECTFLETFEEFIAADFDICLVPFSYVLGSVCIVEKDSQNEFGQDFAFETSRIGCVGLGKFEDRLKVFEE